MAKPYNDRTDRISININSAANLPAALLLSSKRDAPPTKKQQSYLATTKPYVRRALRMQCHKINSIDKPTRQSPKRKFPADLPIPGWNKRVMTKSDFSQTCEREGIIMLRLPLPNGINGMYTRMHNTPIIWIDSRLRGTERLRTEFHELGHYFFHDPKALIGIPTKQEKKMRARFEVEANAIALDALAPALRLNSAKRKARRCS